MTPKPVKIDVDGLQPPLHTKEKVAVLFNNKWNVFDKPATFFDIKVRLLDIVNMKKSLVPSQLKLLDYKTGSLVNTPSRLPDGPTDLICLMLEDGVFSSDYENAKECVNSNATVEYVAKDCHLKVPHEARTLIAVDTMIARDYLQKRGTPLGSKFQDKSCLIFCAPTVANEIQGAVERKDRGLNSESIKLCGDYFHLPASNLSEAMFQQMFDEFYKLCLADRPIGSNDQTTLTVFPKTIAQFQRADKSLCRKYTNDFRIFVESVEIARQYRRSSFLLDKSLVFVSRNNTHVQALEDSMWFDTRDKIFGGYFGRDELVGCRIKAELR